jgi:hypothetical protein
MNTKGSYTAFLTLLAMAILIGTLLFSTTAPSSDSGITFETQAAKRVIENTRNVLDQKASQAMADAIVAELTPLTCAARSSACNAFPASGYNTAIQALFDTITTSIEQGTGIICTTALSPSIASSSPFTVTLTCNQQFAAQTREDFSYSTNQKFTLQKTVSANWNTVDGLSTCTITVRDAHAGLTAVDYSTSLSC